MTFDEIAKELAAAQDKSAWTKGIESKNERETVLLLRAIWLAVNVALDPNETGKVPVVCSPSVGDARRAVGKYAFCTTAEDGSLYGVDVTLSVGGLKAKVTFGFLGKKTVSPDPDWHLWIGKKRSDILVVGPVPILPDAKKAAADVVSELRTKLIEQVPS